MQPIENDNITNADESKKIPDENPEPLVETKKDEPEPKTSEKDNEKPEEKIEKSEK